MLRRHVAILTYTVAFVVDAHNLSTPGQTVNITLVSTFSKNVLSCIQIFDKVLTYCLLIDSDRTFAS